MNDEECNYRDDFMSLAFAEARDALEAGEVPIGCVFVRRGEVIASGRNAANATKDPTRHAELVCHDLLVTKGDVDFFGEVEVYVNCEPCIMCASALQQIGVKGIYFGCSNPRFGGCGTVLDVFRLDTTRNVKVPFISKGHRSEEAVALLKEFYQGENPNAPEEKRKVKRK